MDLKIDRTLYEFHFHRDCHVNQLLAYHYLVIKAILANGMLSEADLRHILKEKEGFPLSNLMNIAHRLKKETRVHFNHAYIFSHPRIKPTREDLNPLLISNIPVDLAWMLYQFFQQTHQTNPTGFPEIRLQLTSFSAKAMLDFNERLFEECFNKISDSRVISSNFILGNHSMNLTVNIHRRHIQFFFKRGIEGLDRISFAKSVHDEHQAIEHKDPLVSDVRSLEDLDIVIRPAIVDLLQKLAGKMSELELDEDVINDLQFLIRQSGIKIRQYNATELGHESHSPLTLFAAETMNNSPPRNDWQVLLSLVPNGLAGQSKTETKRLEILQKIITASRTMIYAEGVIDSGSVPLSYSDLYSKHLDLNSAIIPSLDLSSIAYTDDMTIDYDQLALFSSLDTIKLSGMGQLSLLTQIPTLYQIDLSAIMLNSLPWEKLREYHKLRFIAINPVFCSQSVDEIIRLAPKQLLVHHKADRQAVILEIVTKDGVRTETTLQSSVHGVDEL